MTMALISVLATLALVLALNWNRFRSMGSGTVLRKTRAAVERGEASTIELKDADRSVLGSFIGAQTAQIAALPAESGFAAKVLSLYDRSDAHE